MIIGGPMYGNCPMVGSVAVGHLDGCIEASKH